jgi:3-hydroxybutyryl-CoA dehydrogenase
MEEIRSVAVLGAGTMGCGIAQAAALGGFATQLHDLDGEALARARSAIERQLARGVELGKVGGEAAAAALGRLSLSATIAGAVGEADLVIEAVPESLPAKLALFAEVVRHAPAGAFLASNTSALSITEMAAASGRPERFAGLHFFNPAHVMRLVELVRGLETSDATVAALSAAVARMGKEVVVVRDVPGFATSRINALIGNEAFRMLEQGVASAEEIDRAVRLGLAHPMGPFEMVDLVGLDVRLAILEHLHATLGEAFRPTNLQRQFVKAGRLGRKSGRGIYRYDGQGRRLP